MCGINGIINFQFEGLSDEIHLMNKNLEHRGPDGQGNLKFNNVYLGHTRLSIQDLSEKGSQPMSNDDKRWIVFNGEIYNFKQIRNDLESKNYKFFSNTDTEVILNSYKEWGEECFLKFNGMWAFAILDKEKKEVIICRDRYGVKPCYLFQNNKRFIFSSEIKPILSVEDVRISQNKRLLNEIFLERHFTTAYENINILEPGHFIKIDLNTNKITKKRWWFGLNHLPNINPNKNQVMLELKERLKNAIKLRQVSDVKIATSLSGGVDSSIIFKELNELSDKNVDLNPFIVRYSDNITFEKAINFSKEYGRNAIIVDGDRELAFEDILAIFGSLEKKQYYSKQLDLYKTQNQYGFKVSIDGHGADECLGGYIDNIKDISINLQNNLVDSYKSIYEISSENLDRIINQNYLTKIDSYINTNLNSFFEVEKLTKIYSDYKIEIPKPPALLEDLKNLSYFDFAFQTLYIKSNYGFLQWLLNKWDKASMVNSVEIRSPYLDWNFFQYALAIPGNLKVQGGKNKAILRDAYQNEIPTEIINDKKKQGLSSNQKNNYVDLILKNLANDQGFIESSYWDSKKLINDIKTKSLDNNKITEITKIIESYAFELGMKSKTYKNINSNNINTENFNLLVN